MCGITGWLFFDRDMRQHRKELENMTDTLRFRGPDDQQTYLADHIGFGHTRLIIIDPEGGRQPMAEHINGRRFVIVYNGELYNTEEVRQELKTRGHSFSSHSDTSVVLHAYAEWGQSCVDRLNGIFAFAVWDETDETLFLVRDRMGVKPLFYTETKSGLIFGSEIKALLAHPEVEGAVDEQGLLELFSLGPSRTPGCGVYKNIHEVKPAHTAAISREGIKTTRYWNVRSLPHSDSIEDTAEAVRHYLHQAAVKQLVSDKPISTFLSGGLDSSALTAFAAKHHKEALRTFSIDYEDNDKYFKADMFQPDSDSYYINQMTTDFGTAHHYEVLPVDTLAEKLEEAVYARDLPGMADIDSSLLWFCGRIKKHASVSLSGECADEIFGGYPWFYKQELLDREGFPWMDSLHERQSLLHPDWRKKLDLKEYAYQRYKETIEAAPLSGEENSVEKAHKEMSWLNMQWFMQTLLERKDRMSMRTGLEVRVPFADHELVQYVWNIPSDWKRLGDTEKGILRRALEPVLPKDVLYRRKNPYPKTHHPRYTEIVTSMLRDVLHDKNAPLHELMDPEQLKELISGNSSISRPWFGQLMKGPQLLAYFYQVNKWLETYDIKIK
ncbi:asparagine synthase (glutamine-hydrolyzing) [Salibacterium halotolerans]|uniref:asparagine synthase (glutamine-hydrolyzing) n=1 Tax=Salibacterium halotolerans TaxID=1884432 RepID=A0A1I5NRY6_9BACI|nr:asparagine synthase (glutamine-hydrolyzing) [Salibacterium halotolerans]SFP24585.1 asparagine synthase (glutamine-hydrolysing) [Salibacterium halotolerans]